MAISVAGVLWAGYLVRTRSIRRHNRALTAENVHSTLGVLLKYQEDLELVDGATVEGTIEKIAGPRKS